MSNRVVIRVSEEAMKAIRQRATIDGTELGVAADALALGVGSAAPTNGDALISGENMASITELAKHFECSLPDMTGRLLRMGISRHRALAKYAVAQKGAEPKPRKDAVKKSVKKAPTKKKSKKVAKKSKKKAS